MDKTGAALTGFLVGGIAGVFILSHVTDNQIETVKRQADSVAAVAIAQADSTLEDAHAVLRQADSVAALRRPVVVRVAANQAEADRADSAVAAARTKDDSIAGFVEEVAELKRVNFGLRHVVYLDSLEAAALRERGDTLEAGLRRAQFQIAGLNAQVQRLSSHRLPKAARIGIKVASYAGAFYAGYKAAKN